MNMQAGANNAGGVGGWARDRKRCPARVRMYVIVIVLTTCLHLYSGNKTIHINTPNAAKMVGEHRIIDEVVADHDVASHIGTTHVTSMESQDEQHHDVINSYSSVDLHDSNATGTSITQSNTSTTTEHITDTSSPATTNQNVGASTIQPLSSSITGNSGTNATINVDVISTTEFTQTKEDDKWKSFFRIATNPIPIYTKEHAKMATRPSSWQCTADPALASNNGTMVAFVHVYKAAGTTVRQFFHELAYSCHKTWVSLARCTGVTPSSIKSRKQWKPCAIEEVADGRRQEKEQYFYPKSKNFKKRYRFAPSNPSFEKFVDIYGGHARMGTGDYIFQNSSHPDSSSQSGAVRYIVFLRDPIERYVSGMLYQNNVHKRDETLEEIVNKVKSRIADERQRNQYWDKSLAYLLTPEQRVAEYGFSAEQLRMLESNGSIPPNTTLSSLNAEARAKLAIHNLHEYNAIIGMTESMSESLDILRHVLLNGPENELKENAQEVFKKFDPSSSQSEGVTANKSSKKEVSTSAVVAELAKDEEHMKMFLEYVQYERMITDYAWMMHNLQYDCVAGSVNC